MISAFFWQNSVNHFPASFCSPRPNLPVTPGISWLPTFAFCILIPDAIWSHHFMANIWGHNGNRDFILGGSKIIADVNCSHETKRCLLLGRKDMANLDSILKSRDITLLTKVHLVKPMVFLIVMYVCESWTIKKAESQRTVVLEKTLESSLDCKESQPVNPKGNQSWIFIGRTDAEAEAPILGPLYVKD